jgi:hypothetical protein
MNERKRLGTSSPLPSKAETSKKRLAIHHSLSKQAPTISQGIPTKEETGLLYLSIP